MNQRISQLAITRSGAELAEIISQNQDKSVRIVPLPLFSYVTVEFGLESSDLAEIDWLCFTSARGVERFFETLSKQSKTVSSHTQFAVVGAKTATALLAQGFSANLQPQTTISEALFEELIRLLNDSDEVGQNIVYVGAEVVRFDPVERFVGLPVNYSRLIVYRAEKTETPEGIFGTFSAEDSILFTSPKAAERFAELFGAPKTRIIAIGAITAEAIEELGWKTPETLTEPDLQLALELCMKSSSQRLFRASH